MSKQKSKFRNLKIWNWNLFRISKLGIRVSNFIKNNKVEAGLLIIILLVGAFMRLYKIGAYMTFLGDEGRDAIVVRRLLVNFDPILIGPGTSIGNMYLGPLYYYLIAPFLLLFNFSPVGPSVEVALIGILTIFFVWKVVREWFPVTLQGQAFKGVHWGALAAALLYAVSPTVIRFSRSSWNPNVMPFFSLLVIYSVWKIFKGGGRAWFITLGVSFSMVLNSHYLGLLLTPTIFIFWLLGYFQNKKTISSYKKNTIYSALIVALLMSPLLIFDARHGWNNLNAIKTFFTVRQETVSIKPWNAIPKINQIFQNVITTLVVGGNLSTGKIASLIIGVFVIVGLLKLFKPYKLYTDEDRAFLLIILWFGFALLGLGLYKQHIYDHYYGFFFTIPFILFGGFFEKSFIQTPNNGRYSYIKKGGVYSLIVHALLIFYILIPNLQNNPLKDKPNRQMQRAQEVAKVIGEKSGGEKLNLAVIAENNYEDGYQYFLEKNNLPVYDIDPLNYDKTLANQLYVVCELPKEKCDPVNNPKAGIANFGWSKIDGEWEVSGVIVYKLIHAN